MFRDRRNSATSRPNVRRTGRKSRATEEDDFLGLIKKTSVAFGWLYYHTRNSIGSDKGFPDVTLVRDNRIIFAELKKQAGKPTKEQIIWLSALKQTPVEVYLWKPSDLEKIIRILQST